MFVGTTVAAYLKNGRLAEYYETTWLEFLIVKLKNTIKTL